MISDEAFDELRADWDYAKASTGSYWHILKHAEVNGFDLAAMKRGIHANLRDYFNDEAYRLNDAEERELVLDLRDRMRLECLLPPLSMEERRDWKWSDIAPVREYRQQPFSNDLNLRTDANQNHSIAAYLAKYHPEAVRYLKSVWSNNSVLPGHNGGPYNKYIVRQLWSRPFVQDAACAVLGQTSEYSCVWFDIDERAAAWPS
jgi:hypothetical protein